MGKREDFIRLSASGGASRQDYIDLANFYKRKSMQGVHDPFRELTIFDMLQSGALPSELKHGGIASLAHGGRIGFAEGKDWKSKIGDFFGKLGWKDTAEDLRQEREMGWANPLSDLSDFFYPEHIYGGDKEKLSRFKKYMRGYHMLPQKEAWNKYKRWLEMENFERANIAKGGLAGILEV